jgi:hypothetical protein
MLFSGTGHGYFCICPRSWINIDLYNLFGILLTALWQISTVIGSFNSPAKPSGLRIESDSGV